ncbi:MAG: hypothetical protein H0Z18_09580 [Thermococcus sp.]|nr:hypothetical protein [Thermococcus sp.]MBO8175495.1 hypothetical protein [Thermococcus sp.]
MDERTKKVVIWLIDKFVDFVIITAGVALGIIIAAGFIAKHMIAAVP